MFKASHIRAVRLPYIYQAGRIGYRDQVDHPAIAEVAASANEIHGELYRGRYRIKMGRTKRS